MLTENPGQLKSMVSSSTEIFLTKRILRYIEMNGQLHCWNLAFEPIERKRLKILKSIMGCSNLCVVFDTPCVLKFLQERERRIQAFIHPPVLFRPHVHIPTTLTTPTIPATLTITPTTLTLWPTQPRRLSRPQPPDHPENPRPPRAQ